jgi:hypothetical protein
MNRPIGSKSASPSAEALTGRENSGSGFFQACLAKSQGSTPEERRLWRDGIYDQSREVIPLQGNLSISKEAAINQIEAVLGCG